MDRKVKIIIIVIVICLILAIIIKINKKKADSPVQDNVNLWENQEENTNIIEENEEEVPYVLDPATGENVDKITGKIIE